MKTRILFIIGCILIFTTISVGQSKKHALKKDYVILRDTLWLNENCWKLINYFGAFYIDSTEAREIDFLNVSVFSFNARVLKYNFGMNFNKIITKDKTKVFGFINYKGEIVGYITGFIIDDKWVLGSYDVFADQSLLKKAYELIPLNKINEIYLVRPLGLGSICYNLDGQTYIFNPLSIKFVNIEEYINEVVTLKTLHNSYKEFK